MWHGGGRSNPTTGSGLTCQKSPKSFNLSLHGALKGLKLNALARDAHCLKALDKIHLPEPAFGQAPWVAGPLYATWVCTVGVLGPCPHNFAQPWSQPSRPVPLESLLKILPLEARRGIRSLHSAPPMP